MTNFDTGRPIFVDGMLLTAKDLSLEQDCVSRRLKQLALSLGWGVIDGMDVAKDPGDRGKLNVSAGHAIDSNGQEIVLDENSECSIDAEDGVLGVRSIAPKLLTACNIARMATTPPDDGTPVRRIEQAELRFFPRDKLDKAIIDGYVLLADVERSYQNIEIKAASRGLTSITRTSWQHGSVEDTWPRSWWIEFSSLIDLPPEHALEVRVRSGNRDSIVPVSGLTLTNNLVTGGAMLCLDLQRPGGSMDGKTVVVRLACDFVVDWKGQPVSGAYLKGRLPSGNWVAGGLFESWVMIGKVS
ncbi:hypothetical protein X770_00870 [Mesorhizobium sp. LSJC269B00]|uniref:hypothetical protein n=1 Tax=Mesorhizobium sp. LSJC269B00 TaxID=1287326 RepID=UPI0003CF5235|nr:hypothetical protein [Mesorhizobium sp. LSJC269B00]ESW93812.1 hypothetical protein X770_00870 [Mesorhizobium sp. LSJC269B00]